MSGECITDLKKLAYDSHVAKNGMYQHAVKEGNVYYYMEPDGTLTLLGKCLCSQGDSNICWHDGPSWSESLTFENTSDKRYTIYRGGYGCGGSRLPITEQPGENV